MPSRKTTGTDSITSQLYQTFKENKPILQFILGEKKGQFLPIHFMKPKLLPISKPKTMIEDKTINRYLS